MTTGEGIAAAGLILGIALAAAILVAQNDYEDFVQHIVLQPCASSTSTPRPTAHPRTIPPPMPGPDVQLEPEEPEGS